MEKSRKKFIKLPSLGGGRELLRKFIKDNLTYPAQALEKGIQGDVIVEYHVNGKGEVMDAQVVHGIGAGCDEEAVRLVKMLNYQGVNNRGMKVISSHKMKIPFRLPPGTRKSGIQMTYVAKKKSEPVKPDTANPAPKTSYTYTLTLP